MRKLIISLFIITLIMIGIIFAKNNSKDNNNLKEVNVAEVAHSVFYAPQYLADALDYFKDEGLDVNITLTSGADNVMSAVLSGDADIGFSGTEATIYVYNGGEKDYVMTFAGLTQKDGSFLVSRKKIDNFTLNDLKEKYVIGGRNGGMPEMTFEWALRQNNIDPNSDLIIDTSIAFAAMEGAFIGGTGDFVTLFEPNATEVEKQGLGYIVAYIGDLGGEVPYTAYNARKSYIEKNEDVIKGFSNAINKALKDIYEKDTEEIAKNILSYFPDTSLSDLITIIDRYKEGNAWKENITINENEWIHIQEIIESAGELKEKVPYNKLIYSKYFSNYE